MNELALFAGAGGGVLGGGCSDGEQFAQLNVMPTPHKFWRNDKTMEFSNLSRFGLTLRLLTESHGEELLMSYLAAFPVRTSAQLEKAKESPAIEADCGKSSTALLAKWDPVSYTWKTAQCSLFEDLELSLGTWPRAGSMRNGACYQQPMLEHLTSEKDAGLWPTPMASSGTGAGHPAKKQGGMNLQTAVRNWPTPCASASKGSSPGALIRKSGRSRENDRIDHAVMASDGGQLNPEWVEWLMGWPIGWTELKPLETAKYREWQQQHSLSLPNEQELSKEAA